ncbi:MAG: site-specific DNA-methyltransferase [Patescibacteria group bacterium]|jgi:DNA modification methylase
MINKTSHKIFYKDSRNLSYIKDKTVDLVVTSPPYPMIQMWDEIFFSQNKKIQEEIQNKNGKEAFEYMHKEMDKTWSELFRVLKDGGIACINIGDATRTINKNFFLYPNHSRIIDYCFRIGFDTLPSIIWRKQTNAPNKFMGSGMLPVGAYVTLEHEYILILRKNGRRKFEKENLKKTRQESSFFWEERNSWFSDVWMDIKGINQKIIDKKTRERSAAFPFNIAYRLINMYSVKGDTVLDPFLGTGTTSIAAMAAERNSIGIEIDDSFKDIIEKTFYNSINFSNEIIEKRIKQHVDFVEERKTKSKEIKYKNCHYNFPVITKSEKEIIFRKLKKINKKEENFIVEYEN